MEISNHVNLAFWLGTSLMVLVVLAFIILALTYQNHFFKMKKNEGDLLLRATLDSERNERQRIAADIHDGILSDLNAVNVYLSIVKRDGIGSCYDEIKAGVEQAIESSRLISQKLMPPLLESQGLTVSLQDYFLNLSNRCNINFSVAEESPVYISLSKRYELYRIIQELTTNLIKYGSATHCKLALSTVKGLCEIHIIDDSAQYDFDTLLKTSTGSGLKNITSRLKIINASLSRQDTNSGNHYIISINN